MAAKEISLKLLVHKEKNQILCAESDKDFIDVLFSFLTMPIATIIRLTAKQAKIGCMSTLYESLEDLDVQYLQTEACKKMLLHPSNAAEENCRKLVVNIDKREPIEYYFCEASLPFRSDIKYLISTSLADKQCHSGVTVNWKISKEESKNGASDGKDGVFVKGRMKYIITDDLQVSPVCIGTTLELLRRLGISDATVLEERNVNLGPEEVLHLLKHSLLSKTALTDMFLPVKDTIDGDTLDLKVMVLDSNDVSHFRTEKETSSHSKKISVNLLVSKSRNKVLYAQVGEEFPDLLFSFLAFPLGSVVKCLGGCTSMGCLDNLYKSVEELGNKGCMKSEECKALLLDPKLVPFFGSMNQLIQINELPGKLTIFNCRICLSNGIGITDDDSGPCSHGNNIVQVEVMNPKFRDVVTKLGGTFMDGPTTFMVTDELIVKPLSTISGISLFNQFNIPINDLEERVVTVREEEVKRSNVLTFIFHSLVSSASLRARELSGGGYFLAIILILRSISSTEVSPHKFLCVAWIITWREFLMFHYPFLHLSSLVKNRGAENCSKLKFFGGQFYLPVLSDIKMTPTDLGYINSPEAYRKMDWMLQADNYIIKSQALFLLKASLISNTVLSDVFLKKPKQLGRRSSLYI